jgi:hypothetical protein
VSSWITTRSLLDASDGLPGQRFSGLISYPPEFLREPDCFAMRSRRLTRMQGVWTPPLLSLPHMGTRYYHLGEGSTAKSSLGSHTFSCYRVGRDTRIMQQALAEDENYAAAAASVWMRLWKGWGNGLSDLGSRDGVACHFCEARASRFSGSAASHAHAPPPPPPVSSAPPPSPPEPSATPTSPAMTTTPPKHGPPPVARPLPTHTTTPLPSAPSSPPTTPSRPSPSDQ